MLFLSLLRAGYSQENIRYNLLPVPASVSANGHRFNLNDQFRIAIHGKPDGRLYAEASRFMRRLSERTGIFLDRAGYIKPTDTLAAAILQIRVERPGRLELGEDESYILETTPVHISIQAETDLGAIHALETLLQLITADSTGYFIPGVRISDSPRFAWRGLLLDVALHFMPIDVIRRTLDGMAAVKMNVLHLHLCNDQGFRVESKLFPRLNELGSDGTYFTQENIREIVRYAGQRGIRVVPEFVVPAHTTAILSAFPELASVPRAYTPERYFGVFDPVLDPTNERVYTFLDSLFTEMSGLFPDAFFHIGGDENTGKDWEGTPHIREFMNKHGMKSYQELQTYFNKRLLPIIRKNGKIMIGWDEILQPGIPREVIIQSWRGKEAFYQSVRKGYRAILSNGYYIDLIQPAAFHYLNDPLPSNIRLTDEEEKRVLGGEATMWSEHVTPQTVDSRIWPRTAAIAERLWSPRDVTDVNDMYRRLEPISLQLEALGLQHIRYRGALLRQLANGGDPRPLEILVKVIEPLKIYERNQGDTMYTVFSPYTKLADVAGPDQPLPRHFNNLVDSFLVTRSPEAGKRINEQLSEWEKNDAAFQELVKVSPVLQEAALLSENLSKIAHAGLEAVAFLRQHDIADRDWLVKQLDLLERARRQSGRCELQVIVPIKKLVSAAGANRDHSNMEPTVILTRNNSPFHHYPTSNNCK